MAYEQNPDIVKMLQNVSDGYYWKHDALNSIISALPPYSVARIFDWRRGKGGSQTTNQKGEDQK